MSYYLAKFVYKDLECGWSTRFVGCKIKDGVSAMERVLEFTSNHPLLCIYNLESEFTPIDANYYYFAKNLIGEGRFIDLDQNPNQKVTSP